MRPRPVSASQDVSDMSTGDLRRYVDDLMAALAQAHRTLTMRCRMAEARLAAADGQLTTDCSDANPEQSDANDEQSVDMKDYEQGRYGDDHLLNRRED